MKNVTLNSKIVEAYKVGLIDARVCNALLRNNRKYMKDCLDINKNNYDEIYNFGIKSFNILRKALEVAEHNTLDFKDIFFEALQKGFYFKHLETKKIYYLQPNTFKVDYFVNKNNEFQCGFNFMIERSLHFVYLDKDDYRKRWALKKEVLGNDE
jgi:hypothetical protein